MKKKLPETSHAANKEMTADLRQRDYDKILLALLSLDSDIYTGIAKNARMDRHAVHRRLGELQQEKHGLLLVRLTGEQKLTPSKRKANEYTLTDKGLEKAKELSAKENVLIIKSKPKLIQTSIF